MRIILNWGGGLYTTFEGVQYLLDLYNKLLCCSDSTCEIDMSRIYWMDANMCAAFGALLQSFFNSRQAREMQLRILNMNGDLENILEKNGFLSDICLNCPKKSDTYKTVIEYRRFKNYDSALFKEYVENHFMQKHMGSHIPQMSTSLQRKFRESIFEIFENAVYHSHTKLGIFACGQYFPKKKLLRFSIADLGIGIRENLYQCLKLNYSPEGAISWALDGENTTRLSSDGTPGGLGLKLIKNFIYLNNGYMTIVSDSGYWNFKNGKEYSRRLGLAFPGTMINITINTAGSADYGTLCESVPKSIF